MNQPPTGTITFLFTDIAGSTVLWQDQPDQMRTALARHDAILRQSIETHNGYVFKTTGDAFCAAFSTGPEAIAAALSAQLALAAEAWETTSPLRVRMALHTGSAQERDHDYFGPPLNRVARLLAAGYGGQTLLSLATQELTRDFLPDSANLLDLGQHRLKDLARPERVFQLRHVSLPADFPPLKCLDDRPNNLSQQLTSFIGREQELTEVKALLTKTRLLTLTGTGGSGKTRLSLQAAAEWIDELEDGVWVIELASLSDPALVPQAVADVLNVHEETGKTIQQTLTQALTTKQMLLVLDNCEHLIAACSLLAADLLRNCSGIHLLATSREALNVTGEQTYRVPSLSLPSPKEVWTAGSLTQYEAVNLFIERAQSIQPSFEVTNANAPAIAQICWHLDGIPLALELAAARVRSLSVEEINTRLDNRFRLLTGGARNTLPRQQTLKALVDWSYDLLTDQEKALLCRLSVFAGGWTLSAAESIGVEQDVEDCEIFDLLAALVDKSLVMAETTAATTRYHLLETVRQYGAERLAESGATSDTCQRHALWCLTFAEQADSMLKGAEQSDWLSRLEAEHSNLRAALTWLGQQPEEAEAELRLAAGLALFWRKRGHYSEGRAWLSRALKRSEGLGSEPEALRVRGKALHGLATLVAFQSEYATAFELYEESLAVYRQSGDQKGIADALNNMGIVTMERNEYSLAKAWLEESLSLRRQLQDISGVAYSLTTLGVLAGYQGDSDASLAYYEESLPLFRQLGDQQGIAYALNTLGTAASAKGDYEMARSCLEECLAINRQMEDSSGIAFSLMSLAIAAIAQEEYDTARANLWDSLTTNQQLGDQQGLITCLHHLAEVALKMGQPRRAVRLLAATDVLRAATDTPAASFEQERIDQWLHSARHVLGESGYASAWDSGHALTKEQSIDYALSAQE